MSYLSNIWRDSLLHRLVFYICGALIFCGLLAVAIVLLPVKNSLDREYEKQMFHSADLLLALFNHERLENPAVDVLEEQEEFVEIAAQLAAEHDLDLTFRLYLQGVMLLGHGNGIAYLPECATGVSDVETENTEWRCLRLMDDEHGTAIEIFSKVEQHERAVIALTISVFAPFLIVLPFAILLLIRAVHGGLAPVNNLARQLSQRGIDDLAPIDDSEMPSELQPVVMASNQFIERVQASYDSEKRFADNAAHELRSPLAAITMLVETMSAPANNANDPEAETRKLNAIREKALQAGALVDQLLTLTRLQNSPHTFSQENDICVLCEHVLAQHAEILEEKDIDVAITSSASHILWPGNNVALTLLFGNLIANAVKFTPQQGSIKISLDDRIVSITDTGPGFPHSVREKIFERFYRVQQHHNIPGSGLGLSIASWVANMHGFALNADNLSEGGAKFSVRRT